MWNSKLPIPPKQSLGSLEFAGRKSAAASISIPAGVLADSFSDWIRESLPSDSNESHRCCGFAPEGSDLDAQSDPALAHMDRSIRSKVINPENNSRASTSTSEYFLPYKASSRKRKLSGNTKEAQESILNEADVESQSVIISSLSQSMLKIVLQHHLRTAVHKQTNVDQHLRLVSALGVRYSISLFLNHSESPTNSGVLKWLAHGYQINDSVDSPSVSHESSLRIARLQFCIFHNLFHYATTMPVGLRQRNHHSPL
nr:hypothetical protein HmN_000179100 [Hymenolepis microstoma]